MLNLNPIKERLAEATPGPWKWREDLFFHKHMQKMKTGNWRARPGRLALDSWVMLLTGPLPDSMEIEETLENIISGCPDEWDYPPIVAIRWRQIKGKELFNATPTKEDAALIENAPTDIAALIAEVERLRAVIASSASPGGA